MRLLECSGLQVHKLDVISTKAIEFAERSLASAFGCASTREPDAFEDAESS